MKSVRNLSQNLEKLPSKRFESHSQKANGLKRPFRVKKDKYGPCHEADFYKNDTLSRSRDPENDTLSSGTSPYRKIYEYPPQGSTPVHGINYYAYVWPFEEDPFAWPEIAVCTYPLTKTAKVC